MAAYGSLCTEFYDLDKPSAPADALAFYVERARKAGGRVLEPMCGSGRFLLPMSLAGRGMMNQAAARPASPAGGRPLERRVGQHPAAHLRREFDVLDLAGGLWDRLTILAHTFEMEGDGLTDFSFGFLDGHSSGDAAREVRDVGGVVALGLLDDDCVLHFAPHLLKPACLKMLF